MSGNTAISPYNVFVNTPMFTKVYNLDFVNANLSSGVLTVNHNLNSKYVPVLVCDNNGNVVQPDDVTLTSTTSLTITLTSQGNITGTWHVFCGPVSGGSFGLDTDPLLANDSNDIAPSQQAIKTYVDNKTISSPTTFYISTTGSNVTGDGSLYNPWATLDYAMQWLQNYRLIATITLQLADGVYSTTNTIELYHEDGQNIYITGTNTYAKTINSIQSSSGSAGAYSIIVNMADVANVTTSDYMIIYSVSGGTNPYYLCGCFPITNVDSVNKRLTLTSLNLKGVPSGAVTGTGYVLKTVLSNTGGSAPIHMELIHGMINIADLAIVTPNASGTGIYCRYSSTLNLSKVGMYLCGIVLYYESFLIGDTIDSTNFVAISNTGSGIFCAYNSGGRIPYITISGSTGYGIQVKQTSSLQCDSITITGCGNGAYVYFSGNLYLSSTAVVSGTTAIAIRADYSGSVSCAGATFLTSVTVFSANNMSLIYTTGATTTTYTTLSTPAYNTIANKNSYVTN